MYYANTNYPPNQRFNKVFKKINSSYEQKSSTTHLPQSSTDNSFYGEKSLGYSQDKQFKFNLDTKTKYTTTITALDYQSTLNILFIEKEVQINRQKRILKTQFVPTSNGLKYILKITESFYLNLSWLHSVQQLEKSKLLILYYDMYNFDPIQTVKIPKIQSLIIEFANEAEMVKNLNAINFIHSNYHDENVEKLYHLLCGDQKKSK